MNRVFITGDTHGTIDLKKITMRHFPVQKELNKSDILIVCGDGGLCWSGGNDDKCLQQWYEDKNFTTLIVDGNHENHVLISKLPIIEKFGGKVHQVSNSVFYTIRGEIYNFNGKSYFSLGGADSVDKGLREEGISWWSQEQITERDIINAKKNLRRYSYKIDYVLTHTGGVNVVASLGFHSSISDVRLSEIISKIKYSKHYCGHYHVDMNVDEKTRILYDDIIEIL